jgi:RNA polymerase sigma factor for flagellar operon FliA
LVLQYLPLVRTIAGRVHQSLPRHVDVDDLVQAGTLGLLAAARHFDAAHQATFPTYAKHRIRGAILDSLRQADAISRDMRTQYKQVEAAAKRLETMLGRVPSEDEVAHEAAMPLVRMRKLVALIRSAEQLSASTRAGDELPDPDFPAAPEARPDALCARTHLHNAVTEVLEALPERQQKILRLYYFDELTMKEIGARFGINESRVSQIHKAAMGAAGDRLRARGIRTTAAA